MLKIEIIHQKFSVCQIEEDALVNPSAEFCFIARTDEEKSLVCPSGEVPPNAIRRDDGWKAFRIQGVLDFSLIGILAGIASLLAANGISIFAVSTYNTDYIFLKSENFPKGLEILKSAGYEIVG